MTVRQTGHSVPQRFLFHYRNTRVAPSTIAPAEGVLTPVYDLSFQAEWGRTSRSMRRLMVSSATARSYLD